MEQGSNNEQYYYLRVVNWSLLCLQSIFMLVLIYTSFKYTLKFSSFKDFYTLLTLLTLITSLLWDCVALPNTYPWQPIYDNELLNIISMKMSKGFFLTSVILYASRWLLIRI